MFKYNPARQRANHMEAPVRISLAARRQRCAKFVVPAALALCFFGAVPALAAAPCCGVTEIAADGQVTAREIDGTRTLSFQVTDAALLRRLKPGAPVYVNFATGQVSLDGKRACCKLQNIAQPAKQPAHDDKAAAAPRNKPGGTTAPNKRTKTVEVPKVEVTASEGSTATAVRGKPATSAAPAKQSGGGTTAANAGAQTQALDPEVLALQTGSDLVARNLGFTALGEVTFDLVNRGKAGINVPVKRSGALQLAASTSSSGPPISIDVWMGTSKMTIQQPSIGGTQTKNLKVTMPSNSSIPKCLQTRDLKVAIDPQNTIEEVLDDNNVSEAANSARPCPDLAIKSIKRHYTGLFDETYQPKVTIVNKGNAPSPSTQVWGTSLPTGIWPVTGWPELVPTHTIPALDPGETTSFRTGGSVLSTNHTAVRVILDRHFKIEESDESNNFEDKQL